MAKPYICTSNSVYLPSGCGECDYDLQEVVTDLYEHEYMLMLNGSQVGDTIYVPKDEYVDNCVLNTVTEAESPYAGAVVGDYYLDITFTHQARHIYVPLSALVGGGYLVVDELPMQGDVRYIYLVDNGVGGYDRYVWADGEWVSLGGTNIDLSDYYTKDEVDGMVDNIMLRVYPIGSIYMSVSSTDPGTLFGGTWTRITDTFLLASGSTYAPDDGTHTTATAGEAKHKLTEAELPKITGSYHMRRWGTAGANITHVTGHFSHSMNGDQQMTVDATTLKLPAEVVTYSFGSGNTHNNMPPYLPVYVWKRTA